MDGFLKHHLTEIPACSRRLSVRSLSPFDQPTTAHCSGDRATCLAQALGSSTHPCYPRRADRPSPSLRVIRGGALRWAPER